MTDFKQQVIKFEFVKVGMDKIEIGSIMKYYEDIAKNIGSDYNISKNKMNSKDGLILEDFEVLHQGISVWIQSLPIMQDKLEEILKEEGKSI